MLATAASEKEMLQVERRGEKEGGALFVAVGNVAYACLLPGSGLSVIDPKLGGWTVPIFDSGNGLRLFPIILS